MVFGWKREEILLLNGIYGIIIGFFHMLFSRNFERFSELIHFGQLDALLVKPVDSQFLCTFWLFGYATVSRIIIATSYVIYIANLLHITFSLIHVASFIGVTLISLLLLYSIWFISITFTIWFSRLNNLVDLMFTITGIARYPQEMLRQLVSYVFVFLLPITLIITLPTKTYLERLRTEDFILLTILSFVFFVFSRRFWKFALRYYTSASS